MFDNPILFKKFGQEYDAEEIVFCEYERGEELYYIVSGKVKISKIMKNNEKVVAYIGKGEFVGEMAIFENKPRTATVITVEKTKFLKFKKIEFFQLIKTAPILVIELIKCLSKRNRRTLEQMNSLLEKDLEKKILEYIYLKLNEKVTNEIKISEIISILNITRDELLETLLPYQKKSYLRITTTDIFINETGWIKRKLK